jgi:hypothetical protein
MSVAVKFKSTNVLSSVTLTGPAASRLSPTEVAKTAPAPTPASSVAVRIGTLFASVIPPRVLDDDSVNVNPSISAVDKVSASVKAKVCPAAVDLMLIVSAAVASPVTAVEVPAFVKFS